MKRFVCVLLSFLIVAFGCGFLLTGCSNGVVESDSEYKSVEQVGDVPKELEKVVADDLFNGVTAFEDRLLKVQPAEINDENRAIGYLVSMMDIYGDTVAEYECESDSDCYASTLTATDDGGFLFVLGFQDYQINQDEWASDDGFASRVIKCDADGKLLFDVELDEVSGNGLKFCLEKNGQYYFFGESETPLTKKRGVYSPTDVFMTVLDKNGKVLNEQLIAGTNYDDLQFAEVSGDNFLLSISSQSSDGDFDDNTSSKGYPIDWVFTINDKLEIIDSKIDTGREFDDYVIGEKDGKPICTSDIFDDTFDAGRKTAFVDYGEYYLVVSENVTGVYENTPPVLSSLWYYTETVYSGYDENNKLLFRASVDSSPDYDEIATDFFS